MDIATLNRANILKFQIADIEAHIRDVSYFDTDHYFDADKHLGAPIYVFSGWVSRELIERHKQEVLDDLLNTLSILQTELDNL